MKKLKIAGKPIIFKNNGPKPSFKAINNVYSRIDDDQRIPVVFETKKQYLQEYIRNQERQKHIRFTEQQKRQYMQSELQNMKGIVSRYTTKNNPYMEPRVVFFNDQKIKDDEFARNARHEYGHEVFERQPATRVTWKMTTDPRNSPTCYGKTDEEEDFAERYAIESDKEGKDKKKIIKYDGFEGLRTTGNRPNPIPNENWKIIRDRNIMFGRKPDWDYNPVEVEEEYVKKDEKSNNYIHLSKKPKELRGTLMYTKADKEDEDIYIDNAQGLDDPNDVADALSHEETHNILKKELGVGISSSFDALTPPALIDYENPGKLLNPKTGGRVHGLRDSNIKAVREEIGEDKFEKQNVANRMDNYYNNIMLRSAVLNRDDRSKDRSVISRKVDSMLLHRMYKENYDGDTLLLPYGDSANINLQVKRLKKNTITHPEPKESDPESYKENYKIAKMMEDEDREKLKEEIKYRKELKKDLPLLAHELGQWQLEADKLNYEDMKGEVDEDDEYM